MKTLFKKISEFVKGKKPAKSPKKQQPARAQKASRKAEKPVRAQTKQARPEKQTRAPEKKAKIIVSKPVAKQSAPAKSTPTAKAKTAATPINKQAKPAAPAPQVMPKAKAPAAKQQPGKKNITPAAKAQRAAMEEFEGKAVVKPNTTDLKKELIDELIEKGKRANFLTYEEIIEFGDKNHLVEAEINDILRTLDKEHIDLIMQDELENEVASLEGLEEEGEGARLDVKTKLESSLDLAN